MSEMSSTSAHSFAVGLTTETRLDKAVSHDHRGTTRSAGESYRRSHRNSPGCTRPNLGRSACSPCYLGERQSSPGSRNDPRLHHAGIHEDVSERSDSSWSASSRRTLARSLVPTFVDRYFSHETTHSSDRRRVRRSAIISCIIANSAKLRPVRSASNFVAVVESISSQQ